VPSFSWGFVRVYLLVYMVPWLVINVLSRGGLCLSRGEMSRCYISRSQGLSIVGGEWL